MPKSDFPSEKLNTDVVSLLQRQQETEKALTRILEHLVEEPRKDDLLELLQRLRS